MVKQEILEGLRNALARGSTLEKAMVSFWNAGYPKEEIEEAAKALQEHSSQTMPNPNKEIPREIKQPIKPLSKSVEKKLTNVKPTATSAAIPSDKPVDRSALASKSMVQVSSKPQDARAIPQEEPKPEPTKEERKQLVSKYEEKTKPKGRFKVLLLFIILFLLIGGLAGIIIFKKELIQFFTNAFS